MRTPVLVFAALALAVSAVLYGENVAGASFHNDSLYLYRNAVEGQSFAHMGEGWPLSWRPLGGVYWPATFELLGLDPRVHLAWTVLVAVGMVVALFALLRELGVSSVHAGAIGLLALLIPVGDATRLWAGASSNTLGIALWLVGTLLALRALQVTERRAWALHAASLGILIASLLLYEVAAIAMLGSAALYLLKARPKPALYRGAVDAALAVGALAWASRTSIYGAAAPEIVERVRPFYGEAAQLFTRTAFPFGTLPTALAVVGVILLVAASLLLVRRARTQQAAVVQAKRWLLVGGIGLGIMLAGWTILLSSPFLPLGTGQANRVNAFAAIGMVLFIYAAVSLAGAAAGSLYRRPATGATVATALVVPILAAGWFVDLRADSNAWQRAATQQRRVIASVAAALPAPDGPTTVFTFGHPIESSPGVPIAGAPWDLQGLLSTRYPPRQVTGFPMHPGTTIACGSKGLQAHNGNDVWGPQAAPYGQAVFVDVATRRAVRIRSAQACRAAAPTFAPGPQLMPKS